MGRVIKKTYGQPIGVLKFFPYQAKAVLLPESGVSADANGNKIIKAGTPYPADDNTCEGYVLEDIDVTNGDAMGAIVFEGTISTTKLTANGVSTPSSAAQAKTPRVTFMA